MFKKLKDYFYLKRQAQIEILETLCTICMYLDHEEHNTRNPYSRYMRNHFGALKELSIALRSIEL
jgi:hypothetical protein